MFELEPIKITEELLLSRNSEESYMTFYTGVNPTNGLFLSPVRPDSRPTACFYRTRNSKSKTGSLILKDFGGDGFHGNFVTVVMRLFNLTYPEALSMIAHDFGIIKKSNTMPNEPKAIYNGDELHEAEGVRIQCTIKEYTKLEIEWWASFGITLETLKKYNVFSIENVFLNGVYYNSSNKNNFIFGYYYGIRDGFEHWKIYYPLKTAYRFLLNTNVLQGYRQLPEFTDVIVITKSLKDVMTLHELGICAVAPQAETVVLSKEWTERLQSRCNLLITNGDWDRAGKIFMIKSRKQYKTVCLSFVRKDIHGKDISDFVKKFGIEKAKLLIDKLKTIVLNEEFLARHFSKCVA